MPFIQSNSQIWRDFLKWTDYDLYHLPGYAETDADLIDGKAIAWIGNIESPLHIRPDNKIKSVSYSATNYNCLIPLIERKINPVYRDLVSPYGFPGILTLQDFQPEAIRSMLLDFHWDATNAGYISTFIRLNPLMNTCNLTPGSNPAKALHPGRNISSDPHIFIADPFKQTFPGRTLSVDPQIFTTGQYNNNMRRNLRRLRKGGCRAIVNDWTLYPDFIRTYRQTMCRKNASPYYHFPDTYFSRLREISGDHLILISAISPDYLGGALFTCYNGIMQYHLSGTADNAVKLSPTKLIIETAIAYAREHQVKTLHLGGGAGSLTTDGLYRFKSHFATHSHPFSCLKFIHNPQVYRELCQGKEGAFFPEYRSKG